MKISRATSFVSLTILTLFTPTTANPTWTYKCANSPGETIRPCGYNSHGIVEYLTPALCVQKCTCTWVLAYPEPKVILSCQGYKDCTGADVESQCNNQDVDVLPFDFQGGQCSCVEVIEDEEVVKRTAETANNGPVADGTHAADIVYRGLPGGDDNSVPATDAVLTANVFPPANGSLLATIIPTPHRGSKRGIKARTTTDHIANLQCKNNPKQWIGVCGSNSHGIAQYLTPAICLQNCKCTEIAVELADAVLCQPYLDCDWVEVASRCTDQTATPTYLLDYQGGQCACVVGRRVRDLGDEAVRNKDRACLI